MRLRQFTISCHDVTHRAVGWLVKARQWNAETTTVAPLVLVQLLVRAAAEMRSLSAIVAESTLAPAFETVRKNLLRLLPKDPLELLPATTRALHSRLPKSLKKRRRIAIIDYHLRPYYGDKNTPGILRAQRKKSTDKFFPYATLIIKRRGQEFTVGLTPVRKGEEQTVVIQRLLDQAAQAGITIQCLLLDRGFYAATTMLWLQEKSIPFLMPMIRRGKKGRTKKTSTGTQRFFVNRRRGWDPYTFTARPRRDGGKQKGVKVTIDVCMTPRKECGGRQRTKGPMVFACHGVKGTPREIAARYRHRFRIETSYRQLGQGLAFPCSKSPVYRLLLVAVALMLRNLWILLHCRYLGPRTSPDKRSSSPRSPRLSLRRMTQWIIVVLNKLLKIDLRIVNPDPQLTNN